MGTIDKRRAAEGRARKPRPGRPSRQAAHDWRQQPDARVFVCDACGALWVSYKAKLAGGGYQRKDHRRGVRRACRCRLRLVGDTR